MTRRHHRICAILGTTGIAMMLCALAAAGSVAWDAARHGDLPVLHLGSAER